MKISIREAVQLMGVIPETVERNVGSKLSGEPEYDIKMPEVSIDALRADWKRQKSDRPGELTVLQGDHDDE